MEWYSDNIPSNWLLCNGQAVSRTAYAELFAVLGTKYGEGDGSTTFNLPDRRGVGAIGKDENDSDFNTLGKKGGSKKKTLALANIPAHTHTFTGTAHTHTLNGHTHSVGAHSHGLNSHTHSIPALSGTAASSGAHQHNVKTLANAANTGVNNYARGWDYSGNTELGTSKAGSHTHKVTTTENTTGKASGSTANSTAFNTGANSGNTSSTTATGTIGEAGSGTEFDVMNPHIVVNYIIKAKQSAGLVADVVDNLNSDSATDALSAKQGKVLKEMIENIPAGTTSIVDVDSLPEITDDNRNQIIRYNGHIYYVDSVSSWRNIKVGDNLSGAKIRADYPKEDEDVSGVLGGFWLDANTTAQTNINYIVTNTGQNIVYWRGGPNETHDYLDANTRLYEMSGGTCFTNLLTNEYTLPTNFGKVTSITSTTSNLYKLLYIKDSGVEKWVKLDNEVAVQNSTPENGEVLWIEDEDIEPVSIEFIADDTGWQTLTLTSDFHTYEDSSPNIPMYRKVGKVVEIVGAIAPTSEIPSGTNKLIATLPEGYRPSKNRYFICQGSGRNIWTLYVYSDGSIVFARYGSSAYAAASTSVWLPFNVTFLVN